MNQFPFPFMSQCVQNNVEQQLASIENQLRKINDKLDKLVTPKHTPNQNSNNNPNNYIQKDDNLYML